MVFRTRSWVRFRGFLVVWGGSSARSLKCVGEESFLCSFFAVPFAGCMPLCFGRYRLILSKL